MTYTDLFLTLALFVLVTVLLLFKSMDSAVRTILLVGACVIFAVLILDFAGHVPTQIWIGR